ncbi:MAG: hypothetical protein R3F44_18640 [Candidatus Competibacteraceae bacterium]
MNLKSIVKATLVACCIYSGATVAATDRSATVSIMNLTGEPIVAAYSHKYSNNYKDSGTTSSKQPVGVGLIQNAGKARFRTGFGTTGKDWWIVSFVDDRGCTYVSSPKNARKFVDGLEKTAIFTGGILVEAGVDIAIAGLLDPEPVGKIAGGVLGGVTAGLGAAMVGLSNTESTAGFKQHILRGQDTSILIMVNKKNAIFQSKSGKSTTGMVMTGCFKKEA